MAKSLGFMQKPSVEDGKVTMIGMIGDRCYIHRHDGENTVTIGTDTNYNFCFEHNGDGKLYDNKGFKEVLNIYKITYDEDEGDDLFAIMQVVGCAVGGHYGEIRSYLTDKDDAVDVPCGLDGAILGKIKEDQNMIVRCCGCTATSEGKNFPEFEKLIEEMFCLNKAKL